MTIFNGRIPGSIFEKKIVIDKINYSDLFSEYVRRPDFPEGEAALTLMEFRSEEMYGRYSGNVIVEFILEDDRGERLKQMFILKNGKNINFAKFIFQVLGYEPEGEFSLKDLEGKRILATIAHYYKESGDGYANIAYCKTITDSLEELGGC